jgi:hypothetical protein
MSKGPLTKEQTLIHLRAVFDEVERLVGAR